MIVGQDVLPWSQLAASLVGVSGAAYLFVHSVMRYDRDYVREARSEVERIRKECDALREEVVALRRTVTEMCEQCPGYALKRGVL